MAQVDGVFSPFKRPEHFREAVITDYYLAIGETKEAAAILFYFERQTRWIGQLACQKSDNRNYQPTAKDLEIKVSYSWLQNWFMGEFSRNKIMGAIEHLKNLGFITIITNLTNQNRKDSNSYLFNSKEIQQSVNAYEAQKKLDVPNRTTKKEKVSMSCIGLLNKPFDVPYRTTVGCPIQDINKDNSFLDNSKLDINENFANFQSKILKISENDIERFLDNDVQDFLEKNKNEVIETENGKKYIVESLPLEFFEKKEKNSAQKEKAKSNLEAKTIEAKKLIQIINEKFQTKYRVELVKNLGIAVNALREYSFSEIETVIDNIYRFNALGNTVQYSSAPKDIFNLNTIEAKLNLKIQQKNQNNGSQTNRQNPTIGHNDLPRINGIVVTQELQEQAIRIAQAQRAKRGL